MAYTEIYIKVTGRLAGDRDRLVIYGRHQIINMAYTQTDINMTGRLAGDRDI